MFTIMTGQKDKKPTDRGSKSSAVVFWLILSSCLCGGALGTPIKMPREDFGMKALGLGGLGGAIGAGVGALGGPMKAAKLGAIGGSLGGMLGGAMEQQGTAYTMLGATAGGYVGGYLGGLVGGTVGNLADSVLTLVSMAFFGVSGGLAGRESFGAPGAVVGVLGGAMVGSGIGTYVVGPAATIATGGIVGLVAAGTGSYIGARRGAPDPSL